MLIAFCRPALLLFLLAGCAGSAEMARHVSPAARLVAGPDLHLLAAWTASSLIYGEAPVLPGDRQPFSALYRVSARGGQKELLARDVYRILIRRQHRPEDPPALLVYMTPTMAGPQTLRSVGRLWTCRPGEPPREVTPADAPLVLQPALLSPDNRYLLSYGQHPEPRYFSIDLTDLDSGAQRRIASALSTSVPRWLGFDRSGPGAQYLLLPNIEGHRPYALFHLTDGALPPLVYPARILGLLPDGRGVMAGPNLEAVELRREGATQVLAKGPVQEYGSFVSDGAAYFLRAAMGQKGAFVRIAPGAPEQVLLAGASEIWFNGAAGRAAYVADGPARNMRAVVLPQGGSVRLTEHPISGYRPLPGDGVLAFQGAAVSFWAPGRSAAVVLSARALSAWPAGPDRFAVLEGQAGQGGGTLRLLRADGEPLLGADPVLGVDLVDVVGSLLVYSIPQGDEAGIWSRRLP